MNARTVLVLLIYILTTTPLAAQAASHKFEKLSAKILKLKKRKSVKSTTLKLPVSETEWENFTITETTLPLPKSLQEKYPEIKSYYGKSSSAELSLTLSADDFFGTIKNRNNLIELRNDLANPFQRKTHHLKTNGNDATFCGMGKQHEQINVQSKKQRNKVISRGETIQTYTLVLTLTGRQSQQLGITSKAEGLAYASNVINFVNSVFRRELAIQFELHSDNEQVIYLNAADDPFPSEDVYDMITLIGANNEHIFKLFDPDTFHSGLIIHPSNVGRGGGRPCNTSRASIGSCACLGLIIHELAHHLGGAHTYHLDSSDEIASSQKSMVGNNSEYVHAYNLEKIANTIAAIENCGTTSSTGNSAPVIEVDFEVKTIPAKTPFVLEASATDVDADADLTFAWQHMQGGATNESKLLYAAKTHSAQGYTRYLPSLESQFNNSTDAHAILPEDGRTIVSRIVVRDNQLPVGAVSSAEIEIQVDASAGPFKVTYPNEYLKLESDKSLDVLWDVAETDNENINAKFVAILLTIDEGNHWSVLAENTPNDGHHTVILPEISSSQCRLMVKAIDNIFYDLNDTEFEIMPSQEQNENQENTAEITASDAEITIEENAENNQPLLRIAQAFTPNNDGLNDSWVINSIEAYPENKVNVIDKAGKLVFTANGYQNNWQGIDKTSSERVPPGPYYYSLSVNGNEIVKSGWIFINY